MAMASSTYDILKRICTVILPAAITCFITIAGLIGMEPHTVEVIAGIASALNTFLGVCLGISSETYWGKHEISQTSDK